MKKSSYTLTKYENIVMDTISDVLKTHRGLYSIETGESSHGGWEAEIIPKNSKAAKLYISDIDSNTIYLAVDDTYFMEFFVNEKEYKKGLPDFKAHLLSALSGRIVGYHVKNKRDYVKHTYLKTVIEFNIKGEITPWCRNVIFQSRFKKRKDVVVQSFETY